MVVAAEAGDGAEALRIGLGGGIDLAILDVAMPRLTGIQVAAELRRRVPEVRVLMLSVHDSERYRSESLRAGAAGYVVKTVAAAELAAACRAAMSRDPPARLPDSDEGPPDPLTPRELQVLKLIAEAFTSDQIAQALVISRRTVDHHRAHILAKLGLRDRVELTRYAIRRGLIQP
jgi:DNA-binding NarL/FixJ family response regulator